MFTTIDDDYDGDDDSNYNDFLPKSADSFGVLSVINNIKTDRLTESSSKHMNSKEHMVIVFLEARVLAGQFTRCTVWSECFK